MMTRPFREGFFQEYWAEFDERLSNHPGNRWRVNDPTISLDSSFGHRWEAQANGVMIIACPKHPQEIQDAELYMEVWGGHPHTSNKHFFLNGKATYEIPEVGTEAGHCTYFYPSIPLQMGHLVKGVNIFQFSCERGAGFWGHFIIDNAALRCYLGRNHSEPKAYGLETFFARVEAIQSSAHKVELSLSVNSSESLIEKVDYFGYYYGFDDTGSNSELGWHGFTHKRHPKNHVGSACVAPFFTQWDISMLDTSNVEVFFTAVVHFKTGLKYVTKTTKIKLKRETSSHIRLIKCPNFPVPFWSRIGDKKRAHFIISEELSYLEEAELWIKIWDGGEGKVADYFQINGQFYPISSGNAIHDIVFSRIKIDPSHLKKGLNNVTLLSDTEHHGIEILLPGPCFFIKTKS